MMGYNWKPFFFFTTELPSRRYPNKKLHPLGEGNGVCNGPLDVVSVDVGVAEALSDISACGLAGEHRIRISVGVTVGIFGGHCLTDEMGVWVAY